MIQPATPPMLERKRLHNLINRKRTSCINHLIGALPQSNQAYELDAQVRYSPRSPLAPHRRGAGEARPLHTSRWPSHGGRFEAFEARHPAG